MTDLKSSAQAKNAANKINKIMEKDTTLLMTSTDRIRHPAISTGIYGLDYDVLGIGGFPQERVSEIYGPESSGKTTLLLTTIAELQKKGGLCHFIDMEHTLDMDYAVKLGVKQEELLFSQPDNGEEAIDTMTVSVMTGDVRLIVFDSVAAIASKAELEGESGESNMGKRAFLMAQACRKLAMTLIKNHCTIIFTNQITSKLGVTFGSNEDTPGGKSLKFYASVRLDVRSPASGRIKGKDDDDVLGARVRIKAVKNKMFVPFRSTEVDLIYGVGFDTVGSLIESSVGAGVIEQTGAWFHYKGEKIGQGRAKVKELLLTTPKLLKSITEDLEKKNNEGLV